MKKRTIVLFFAAAFFAAPARASATGFHFQVPPGWVDLSPSAPPANFARLTPEQAQLIRDGRFAFYAADVEHSDDGFTENVNVTLEPGAAPVTEALLQQLTAEIDAEVRKQRAGMSERIVDTKLVQIGGVTCGRYVGELQMVTPAGAYQVKQIGYIIPGHEQHAIITYSTTPADFARYQPVFDAAALATTGAEEPTGFFRRVMNRAGSGAIYGALFGLIGALLAVVVGRKKA
ncbi:MAG TPA: hypothetical protein VFF06_24175 [Polyangia bacterium]|nr:hypothetical protein [Polyangia bacterium]